MLKAVLIGTSGHYAFALGSIKKGADCVISAMAPGPDGSFSGKMKNELNAKYYSDYLNMLDEEAPDIAIINPEFSHTAECAAEALQRGISVFCEKPVSITWEGLKELETVLQKSGAFIFSMMGMRYEAAFAGLKAAVDGGELGEVRLIHAQKSYKLGERPEFYKKRETYGGTIPWVGAHPVDLIYWLSGRKRYKSVFARHTTKANCDHGELESSAVMAFEMEDEILATVNIDYLRPAGSASHGDDRIRVMGDRNWAEVAGGRLYVGGEERPLPEDGDIFLDFCERLKGKDAKQATEDSLYVTKICLAARDSADRRKIVETEY